MSNAVPIHYVKVVGVTEEIIQFGSDLVLHYKKLEVIEEIGWWLDRFYVNMFPGIGLYEDIKFGDRLFLRVSRFNFQPNCLKCVSTREFCELSVL